MHLFRTRLLATPRVAGEHVEQLHQRRKRHGGINIALRNMEAHAFGNQRRADHHQEGERQHDDGRVAFDEIGERRCGQKHDGDGDDDRDDHDRQMRRHADGGDDAVHREDEVEQQDLADRAGKGRRRP